MFEQIVWLLPALAAGRGFTVIFTVLDVVHPVAVIVSVKVYVVVVVGLTVGLEAVEVNPDGLLDQEYVSPVTELAPMVAAPPLQKVAGEPALAAGTG